MCRVYCGGVNSIDTTFLYGDILPHICLPLVKWFVEDRICGIDFSGIAVEAFPKFGYKVGDAIFGTIPPLNVSFAEYVRVPIDFISHKPTNLSFVKACTFPLVALNWYASFG